MAITSLEQSIAQKQGTWVSALFSSQTFWVIIAVLLAATYLSVVTDSFDTPRNLFNTTYVSDFLAQSALAQFGGPAAGSVYGDPRYWGVRLNAQF